MATADSEPSHAAEGVREVPGLLGPGVLVLSAANDPACLQSLSAREAELVAFAVDKRKREFGTGRFLAQRALARFGCAPCELLRGAGGAPIWPDGYCGSISHCDTRAVVAVAERATAGSLGIDIEHRSELARRLWTHILLPEEIAELERDVPEPERGRRALLAFSAKEAFYKAQYAWSGQFLNFHGVRVHFEAPSADDLPGAFECTLQLDVPPFRARSAVRGRYRIAAFPSGESITAVNIPDPNPRARP